MKQYDEYTIREAMHNAIAHQDYTLQQRIVFVEGPSTLYYGNGGSFIPGTIENAMDYKGPQLHYRNECLCRGMVNFNMIDTVSRGIKKMFNEQWRRHFPMPAYEIDTLNNEVGVKIYGNTINETYTKLLKENNSLTLEDCILLDAVQKGHRISENNVVSLMEKGLLEGDITDYHISIDVAKKTRQLPEYTRNKGLDKAKIQQMIIQYLQNAGSLGAKRDGIFDYLKEVLPQNKTQEQQERMIGNILSEMKEDGVIYAELRFAPQLHTQKGMPQETAIQAALRGLKKSPIPGNLILCCMRGDSNQKENLETRELAKKYLVKDGGVFFVR